MAKCPAWCLLTPALLYLLSATVLTQDLDLLDAFDEPPTKAPAPKPKPKPAGGGGDFDLTDLLGPTTAPPRVTTTTKAPANPKPKGDSGDLELTDALDPNNDRRGKDKGGKDGQFSDSDLMDLDGYHPDKGKGGRHDGQDSDENNYDTMAETGTIAGIVSAVAMAFVGAVGSYISYQKKKLCFSIQQSLNAEIMKSENPDAVVSTEPQVQQTLLESSNAEPPSEENKV